MSPKIWGNQQVVQMDSLDWLPVEPDWAGISRCTAYYRAIGRFGDHHDLPDAALHQYFIGIFFVYDLHSDQASFGATSHQLSISLAVARFHRTEVVINIIPNRQFR